MYKSAAVNNKHGQSYHFIHQQKHKLNDLPATAAL